MAEHRFSKGEALKFSWEIVKANLWFFVGLELVAFAIMMAPGLIESFVNSGKSAVIGLIFTIISLALQYIVMSGMIKIVLKFVDKEEAKIGDLFSCLSIFWKFLAGNLLSGLIVVVGLFLLIVPGIILGLKFTLMQYLIVDKGMGPIVALKESSRIMQGAKWDMFLMMLILIGVNFLGVLAIGVGLLVTIPISTIAIAYIYRKLSSEHPAEQPIEQPVQA